MVTEEFDSFRVIVKNFSEICLWQATRGGPTCTQLSQDCSRYFKQGKMLGLLATHWSILTQEAKEPITTTYSPHVLFMRNTYTISLTTVVVCQLNPDTYTGRMCCRCT